MELDGNTKNMLYKTRYQTDFSKQGKQKRRQENGKLTRHQDSRTDVRKQGKQASKGNRKQLTRHNKIVKQTLANRANKEADKEQGTA